MVNNRDSWRFGPSALIQRSTPQSVDWPNCELTHNVDLTSDVMMRPTIDYVCPNNNLYDLNDPG
jgi:hypothetical protein